MIVHGRLELLGRDPKRPAARREIVRGQDHGVGDAPLERGYSAVLAAARS